MGLSDHLQSASKYISAKDLPDGWSQLLTIRDVQVEQVGRDKEHKHVIYFDGKEKGWVLSAVINKNRLVKAFGEHERDLIGKQVELRREMTEYQGDDVPCLRVHIPLAEGDEPQDIPF